MSWDNEDWKGWRLFLLLHIVAKRREAFIRDLRQSDAIDSIDAIKSVF